MLFNRHECLCGLSLWATEHTTHPALWARHLAHIRAYQNGATPPGTRNP